jgi:hypothetical protein
MEISLQLRWTLQRRTWSLKKNPSHNSNLQWRFWCLPLRTLRVIEIDRIPDQAKIKSSIRHQPPLSRKNLVRKLIIGNRW